LIINEEKNISTDFEFKSSPKRYNRTNMGSPERSISNKRGKTKEENRFKYGSIK